jgi:DNA-binding transcriptional regulator YdaS (Cro superfamily)
MPDYDPPLQRALREVSLTKLAAHLGINPSAIPQWKRVPAHHAHRVSDITGIPVHELRPDVFREKATA